MTSASNHIRRAARLAFARLPALLALAGVLALSSLIAGAAAQQHAAPQRTAPQPQPTAAPQQNQPPRAANPPPAPPTPQQAPAHQHRAATGTPTTTSANPLRHFFPFDLDGDSVPDTVAREMRWSLDTPALSAFIAHSGHDDMPIQVFTAYEPNDLFGWVVVSLGDLDDDGVPDLAVAAPRAFNAPGVFGRIYIVSGASGQPLWAITDPEPGFLGVAVSLVSDHDDDSVPDLLVAVLRPMDLADPEPGSGGGGGGEGGSGGSGGVIVDDPIPNAYYAYPAWVLVSTLTGERLASGDGWPGDHFLLPGETRAEFWNGSQVVGTREWFPAAAGDLTGDGVVNGDDLRLMLELITGERRDELDGLPGLEGVDRRLRRRLGDLNGDGVVDVRDLLVLVADYGLTAEEVAERRARRGGEGEREGTEGHNAEDCWNYGHCDDEVCPGCPGDGFVPPSDFDPDNPGVCCGGPCSSCPSSCPDCPPNCPSCTPCPNCPEPPPDCTDQCGCFPCSPACGGDCNPACDRDGDGIGGTEDCDSPCYEGDPALDCGCQDDDGDGILNQNDCDSECYQAPDSELGVCDECPALRAHGRQESDPCCDLDIDLLGCPPSQAAGAQPSPLGVILLPDTPGSHIDVSLGAVGTPEGGTYRWIVSGAEADRLDNPEITLYVSEPGLISARVIYTVTVDGKRCVRAAVCRFMAWRCKVDPSDTMVCPVQPHPPVSFTVDPLDVPGASISWQVNGGQTSVSPPHEGTGTTFNVTPSSHGIVSILCSFSLQNAPVCQRSVVMHIAGPWCATNNSVSPVYVQGNGPGGCGGSFGLTTPQFLVADVEACIDTAQGSWTLRVQSVESPVFLDVCTLGRIDVSSAFDPHVTAETYCTILNDLTPLGDIPAAPYSQYFSEVCVREHEETHYEEWQQTLNSVWPDWEALIEAITVECSSDLSTAEDAAASVQHELTQLLSNARVAAATVWPNDPPGTSQAYPRENACLASLRAAILLRAQLENWSACP